MPEEQPTQEIQRTFFECPDCNETSDQVSIIIPVETSQIGGISVERINRHPDRDIDSIQESWLERSDTDHNWGNRAYECPHCGNALTKEQIRASIKTVTETVRIPNISLRKTNSETALEGIQESPDRYVILQGPNKSMARDSKLMPATFSPEVIAPYQERKSGYEYAHLAICPNCQNEFMIGKTEKNITCSKCLHEFNIDPLIKSYDPQNARERSQVFDSFNN